MSNTSWEKGSFDYIPDKYIFEDFREDIITNMIKLQKSNLSENIHKRAFLILDDCVAENEIKSNVIKKLAIMGRHYNITTILTTQYIHLLPPVLRANSHYNVFFNVGEGVREMKATYDAFGNRFPNYETFKKYYYKGIENHKFIMWNNEQGQYKIFRCPETIPSFKIKYNNKISMKNKISLYYIR
jgi:hypothetical protein